MALSSDTRRFIYLLVLMVCVFGFSALLLSKYNKAAIYVCYYGEWVKNPYQPEYVQNDPLFRGLDNKSIKDIYCFETNNTQNFTCPAYYDKTQFLGYTMTTGEIIEMEGR